jgi:hypothetical protein
VTLTGEVRSALRISNFTRLGRTGARTSIATMGTSASVVEIPAINNSSAPLTLRDWLNNWPTPKNRPYTST